MMSQRKRAFVCDHQERLREFHPKRKRRLHDHHVKKWVSKSSVEINQWKVKRLKEVIAFLLERSYFTLISSYLFILLFRILCKSVFITIRKSPIFYEVLKLRIQYLVLKSNHHSNQFSINMLDFVIRTLCLIVIKKVFSINFFSLLS